MSRFFAPFRDFHLELLLLLTALFASLTGSAGEGGARQVQGVAVVHAAEVAQAAVQPSRAAHRHAVIPALVRPAQTQWFALAAAPVRSLRLVFERRLE